MFPRSLKLNKIFNKNVIKVNYSCTKNITKRFILDWPRKSLKEEAITTKSNYLICKLYSNSSALSSYAWQKKQSKMKHQVWHKKFHDLHRKLLIVTYPTPSDPWHKKPKTCFKMRWWKQAFIAWKVSKYGVISGPYFPVFGLNTEIYFVNLRIQSEYRKIRTRNNSVFEHFSRSKLIPLIGNDISIKYIFFSKFALQITWLKYLLFYLKIMRNVKLRVIK